MIIFKSINKLNKELYGMKNVGFVPTMGSLHKGHISIIKKSKILSNKTLVSIFINPTQFDNKNDYKKYPKNLKRDINILVKYKVDYLLIPSFKELYGSKKIKKEKIDKKDKILCAKFRKGHFEGVLTVINQFLRKLKINKIYLGEKDYQQLFLVKKFIKKKRFKINIIPCKTIRQKNYFPYSSRNKLLSKSSIINGQKVSLILNKFYHEIKKNKKKNHNLNLIKKSVLKCVDKIDYFEIRNKFNLKRKFSNKNFKIFIAYYLNKVRVIDNY
tara:strand:- start:559 stop:1371 length:813 start_codon:yes stop_codon:yes gene_type:complete